MAELPQYNFNEKPPSSSNKVPLFTLLARVVTVASCVISVVVLQNNEVTWDYGGRIVITNYTAYSTYRNIGNDENKKKTKTTRLTFFMCRYMFGVMVVGIFYSILHIPFAAYYLVAKKRLVDRYGFRLFEFYGDKIILLLLATGAGGALGVTVELSRHYYGENDSKIHTFLGLMYVPNALLIAAFVGSVISSVQSSLNLHKSEE